MSFNTKDDLLNRSGVHYPIQLPGIYKATPTGKFYAGDFQFVQVRVLGLTLPARPCYAFGNRFAVPSAEWLEQYGGQIFFWVAFEEGVINKCVWLGWAFREGFQQDVTDVPHQVTFRSEKFIEEINDSTQTVTWSLKDTEYTTQFGIDGFVKKVKKVTINVDDSYTLTATTIVLGSGAAKAPYVLGDTLNANLTTLLTAIKTLSEQMAIQMTALGTAAATNQNTASLTGGFQSLAVSAKSVGQQVTTLMPKLAEHLSKKITGE